MDIRIIFQTLLFGFVVVLAQQQPDNRVQLSELKPEEVQSILSQQNTDLKFAPKLSTLPVLRKSAQDPDLEEDVYEASQFHGQDGLGRYLYGYSNPDHAKVEARSQEGNIRGSYQWIEPNGEVIKVQYWDDGNGFQQQDNIPKVVLEPVRETEEVHQARLEHERLWKELAAQNKALQNQNTLIKNDQDKYHYNDEGDSGDYDYNDGSSSSDNARVQNPNYNRGLQSGPQQSGNRQQAGSLAVSPIRASSVQQGQQQRSGGKSKFNPNAGGQEEEEEVTSEPRGFFYSFVYPVTVTKNKTAEHSN